MTNAGHSKAKTIVLVTNQFNCERIIHSGKLIADTTDTELSVFSVENGRYPQNPLALEHLFNVSKQHGAVMNVAYSDDPMRQIVHFIKFSRTRNVLTGIPRDDTSIVYDIWRKFTHIKFFTVDEAGNLNEVSRADIPMRPVYGRV